MSYSQKTVCDCHCERCGKDFTSRTTEPPKRCPYCGSGKWNQSDVGQNRGVAENRVMPKSRRAADTSVGRAGTPEATVLRAGANPASPTRNTASGSQSQKISGAAPAEVTYVKDDYIQ